MVKAVRDRYDGRRRNPWNEMECGSNYARSMASFALLLIYSGLRYDMPDQRMGFIPLKGKGQFFWSLEGTWGTVEITKSSLRLSVEEGCLTLRGLITELPVRSACIGGKTVSFTAAPDGIDFAAEIEISAGEALTVTA